MSYTEFTCRAGGNNLNAGTFSGITEEGVNPLLIFTSGTWLNSIRRFTVPVASGDPRTLGVTTGCFVSIYSNTPHITGAGIIGQVSGITATDISLHASYWAGNSGNAIVPSGANATTMRVGGAWQGPNGRDMFPFGTVSLSALRMAAYQGVGIGQCWPRINFKNDQIYTMATGINHAPGDINWQGYSGTFGDFGRATFQFATTSGNFNSINFVGGNNYIADINIYNNGSVGTANYLLQGPAVAERIIATGSRAFAFGAGANISLFIDCIAMNNNTTNTASVGAFNSAINGTTYLRCVAINNNRVGFLSSRQCSLLNCISAFNTEQGALFTLGAAGYNTIQNCTFYRNGRDAIRANATNANAVSYLYIQSCDFIHNSGHAAIVSGASRPHVLFVYNCLVATGTFGNTKYPVHPGTGLASVKYDGFGMSTYPLNIQPYAYPSGGNFTQLSPLARNSGYCTFLEASPRFTGTIAYDNVGATSMNHNILYRRGDI